LSAPQSPHDPALQFWLGPQALQLPAWGPQASSDVPGWQTPFESQQPLPHELAVQAQRPLWQARPEPQLDSPQQAWPLRPQAWQLPLEHCWPAVQVVPQAPQFWPSVWVSTQRPPQSCSPERQLAWQLPLEQLFPVGQTVPQLPQLWGSLWRSAQ
jgi:hypothetical protein